MVVPLHKLKHNNFYYLNIEIEKLRIPVVLDTGCSTPFVLHKDFLDLIQNKKDNGEFLKTIDINGNEHKQKSYFINSIQIEKLIDIEATVEEDNPFFHTDGSKVHNPDKPLEQNNLSIQEWLDKKLGLMGFKVLKWNHYWCIDFLNSKMYAIRDWKNALKKLQLSSENLREIPLLENKQGIEIVIDTDFGVKRFIIDTACSKTLMRCPSEEIKEHTVALSSKFKVNDYNLGKQKIYFFNLPKEFNFDGLLGMDFLKDKTILFDFKNKKMFIKFRAF